VINEGRLPMTDKYREQLQVVGIDVIKQEGQSYFSSAMQKFNL